MIPILFEKDTESFAGGGICRLAEATAWTVKEVLNGEFELEMSYPAEGEHYAELKTERIIYAKPNPYDTPQAFVIYAVSKPLRGRIKIFAEHVSHRQSKITVAPFHATSLATALYEIKRLCVNANTFTFTTNMNVVNEINSNIPRTLRNALYGRIISLYGGEVKYDNYAVQVLARRGSNKGFTVRYGKNLLDFNQEEDVSAVYDGIYPYYFVQDLEDEEDFTYVELPEKIIKIGATSEKIMPLNLTAEFAEEPDEEELREKAQSYLKSNDINAGVLSLTVNFVLFSQTEEYKHIAPLERAELGDDVSVYVPKRGVSVKSRIVKTVYDGKNDRYESVTIGEIQTDIADTMVTIKNEVAASQTKISANRKAIATVTLNVDANKAQIDILSRWIEDNEGDVQSIAEINAAAQANKASIELLAERVNGAETAIAQIDATVDENKASIASLTEWQTDTDAAIALIEQDVSENESNIKTLTEKSDAHGTAIAEVKQTANANKADIELLAKRTTDSETNIAGLQTSVSDNAANIKTLAERTTEAETLIAQIDQEVDKNRASIELLAEFQTETEKNIAEIEAEADAQGAKIGLIVETDAAGENAVKGAILVEAINGQSTAKIAADRLDIEGKTLNIKVNAANITGTLTANQINTDGLNVTNGTFDHCTINSTCTIKGTLTGNSLATNAGEIGGGSITYTEWANAYAQYKINLDNHVDTSAYAQLLMNSDTSGYTQIYLRTHKGGFTISEELAQISHTGHIGVHGNNDVAISTDALLRFDTVEGIEINVAENHDTFFNFRNGYGTVVATMYKDHFIDTFIIEAGSENGLTIGSENGYDNKLLGTWYGTLATSSDARKKRDIAEIPGAWEKIFDKLCARIYRYKDDEAGKLHFGFVAQELAAAIAEAGENPEEFAVLRRGKDGYYSIVYDELIALCVLEIQKLKRSIAK